MLDLKKPTARLIGLSLSLVALAGCGLDNRMLSDRSPKVAALGIEDRRQVQIRFRDPAQLDAIAEAGVDLFENVDMAARTVDGTVTPKTEATLKRMGVRYEVTRKLTAMGFPAGYQTVETLMADMQGVAGKHSKIARLVTIGTSLEGRPIVAVRLTSKPDTQQPAVLITSGQHSRELPPVQITSRFIHLLTESYGTDPAITKLVDTRDIWVVPLVNPDGRTHVEKGDAMWRKNRRDNADGSRGVDTNRNADDHWSQGVDDGGSDSFRGSAPFSEPESRAIRDLANQQKFKIALDFHCYGGMILWPPGYSNGLSRDDEAFRRIGNRMAKPGNYRAGTIAQTIYKTYGDMATWMYSTHGTLAYGIELNDGRFNPPATQVEKDWSEWKDSLLYVLDAAGNPLAPSTPVETPRGFPRI